MKRRLHLKYKDEIIDHWFDQLKEDNTMNNDNDTTAQTFPPTAPTTTYTQSTPSNVALTLPEYHILMMVARSVSTSNNVIDTAILTPFLDALDDRNGVSHT